jgi:hypothetical protein
MRLGCPSVLLSLSVAAFALALGGCAALEEGPEPRAPRHDPGPIPRPPVGYTDPAGRPTAQEVAADTTGRFDGYDDDDPQALTVFRSVLDGHGSWAEHSEYGTVWIPSQAEVGTSFTPYVSAGRWTYDGGYVWVSDYSWGWVPFHYGRWVFSDGVGWVWIPGRRYAGAWVTWHVGPAGFGHVGWSPLSPSWVWHRGRSALLVRPPPQRYVYCPTGSVFNKRVGDHVVVLTPAVAATMRPYVPAQPGVDGAGGEADRVLAQPSVDRRVIADPSVAGPPPRDLGLLEGEVPRVPNDDKGLWRARQLAEPRMGERLADAADRVARSFAEPPPAPREVPFAPSRSLDAIARAPQYKGIEPRAAPTVAAPGDSRDAILRGQGPLPALSNQGRSAFDRPSLFVTHPTFSRPIVSAAPPSGGFVGGYAPSFGAPGPSFGGAPAFAAPAPRGPAMHAPPRVIVASPPQGGFVGARPSVVTSTPSSVARGFRP